MSAFGLLCRQFSKRPAARTMMAAAAVIELTYTG